MRVIEVRIKVPVPALIERMVLLIVLAYRRVRYGYTFRRIKLTRGKYAIVDAADFEWLNQYKWHCSQDGYAKRAVPNKSGKGPRQVIVFMHKLVCSAPEGMIADHINRNSLDNRGANLRPATKKQNVWNRKFARKGGKTRYNGIYWDENAKKWRAGIMIDGRHVSLGCYGDEKEAAKAYDRAAEEHRGEWAVLNFPKK